MFRDLIAFELRYQFSQTLIRVATVAFFLFGVFIGFTLYGGPNVVRLAPVAIAQSMVMLSLTSFFGLALFTVNAVLRDRTHGMEPLIHASPVGFFSFLSSRLFGLIVVVMTVVCLAVCGMMVGGLLPSPRALETGPFRLSAFLLPMITFVLPNVFLGLSVLFCVATLARSQIAVYVAGIGLYMAYLIASMLSNSPLMAQSAPLSADETALAVLLDPFGVFPLYEQIRYWDLAAKNSQLILLEGDLLANRLIWMTVSLGLCCLAYRFFRFREAAAAGGRRAAANPTRSVTTFAGLSTIAPTLDGGFMWRALRSKMGLEMRLMLRGVPLILLSILCLFLFGMILSEELGRGEIGVPLQATAALIIVELQEPIRILGPMIIIFFAAEWAWLERGCRVDGIIDSSAVPSVALWAAKWLGLGLLVVYLLSLAVLIGIGYQLVRGSGLDDLHVYGRFYLFVGLPMWFFAGWVLALQNFLPNKFLGMLAGAGLLVLGRAMRAAFLLELPMLNTLYFPNPFYSEFAQSGSADDLAFWGLVLHFGAACLVGAVALLYHRRGLKRRAFGMLRPVVVLAVSGLLLTVGTGVVVFYQTHIAMSVASAGDIERWRAEYERRFAGDADQPQPVYREGHVEVDLFPERRRYQVRASYTFVNPHDQPLDQLTLTTPPLRGLSCQTRVDGASLKSSERRFGVETYVFTEPLAPGAEGRLHFEMTVKQSGFASLDGEHYVLPGGSYIELSKFVPQFGYLGYLELRSERQRRLYDLPPHEGWPALDSPNPSERPWFALEMTASVPVGSRAVTLGELQREWEADGRLYSKYRIDRISDHWYALAAGDFQIRETTVDDIAVSVWYHAAHEANVDTMLTGARDALTYYQKHWGDYPYEMLRIVEIPAFSNVFGATSYATTIFAVENRVFLRDQRGEDAFNLVGRTVAHEIAHQWWGGLVRPASVEGYRMLTEVLCQYSEAAVLSAQHDWSKERFYLDDVVGRYFFFRGFTADTESPLHRLGSETHLAYFKGSHATHLTATLLGRETVNQRLAEFYNTYRYPARPKTTDFLELLLRDVPDPERQRIQEVFTQVVTYDLRLTSATRADSGKIALALQADVFEKAAGRESLTLEWVALGRNRQPLGPPQSIDVAVGEDEVHIEVPSEAVAVEIDPRRLFLEARRNDNRREITVP